MLPLNDRICDKIKLVFIMAWQLLNRKQANSVN